VSFFLFFKLCLFPLPEREKKKQKKTSPTHNEPGDAQVLDPLRLEDDRPGVEPLDVLGPFEELRHDAAERAEHGPAGVDDLDRAVARERLRVGGEARGVPAVVARELAGQVGGRGGEGPEEGDAVGAVELGRGAGLDGGLGGGAGLFEVGKEGKGKEG